MFCRYCGNRIEKWDQPCPCCGGINRRIVIYCDRQHAAPREISVPFSPNAPAGEEASAPLEDALAAVKSAEPSEKDEPQRMREEKTEEEDSDSEDDPGHGKWKMPAAILLAAAAGIALGLLIMALREDFLMNRAKEPLSAQEAVSVQEDAAAEDTQEDEPLPLQPGGESTEAQTGSTAEPEHEEPYESTETGMQNITLKTERKGQFTK